MGGARARQKKTGFPEQLKVVTKSRGTRKGERRVVLRWNKYAILYRRIRDYARDIAAFDGKKTSERKADRGKKRSKTRASCGIQGINYEISCILEFSLSNTRCAANNRNALLSFEYTPVCQSCTNIC